MNSAFLRRLETLRPAVAAEFLSLDANEKGLRFVTIKLEIGFLCRFQSFNKSDESDSASPKSRGNIADQIGGETARKSS
jgi:hypothetical protein